MSVCLSYFYISVGQSKTYRVLPYLSMSLRHDEILCITHLHKTHQNIICNIWAMKKGPRLFFWCIGDEILPSYVGIPIFHNQYLMEIFMESKASIIGTRSPYRQLVLENLPGPNLWFLGECCSSCGWSFRGPPEPMSKWIYRQLVRLIHKWR